MNDGPARDGIPGFIADLNDYGVTATQVDPVVQFEVLAADGARAGQVVISAVSVNELSAWPAIPPHWVHLPVDVKVEPTNVDLTDTLPGLQRHSRGIEHWGDSEAPGAAWLAHVRSVLSAAVA